MTVGRRSFPFDMAYFQGRFVLGRVVSQLMVHQTSKSKIFLGNLLEIQFLFKHHPPFSGECVAMNVPFFWGLWARKALLKDHPFYPPEVQHVAPEKLPGPNRKVRIVSQPTSFEGRAVSFRECRVLRYDLDHHYRCVMFHNARPVLLG